MFALRWYRSQGCGLSRFIAFLDAPGCRYQSTSFDSKDERKETRKSYRLVRQKRMQDRSRFIDSATVMAIGGSGGNGTISFHREKYKSFGPPSGGNGGAGGSVYIIPSTRVTSLSHLRKVFTAGHGGTGQGTWQHGKRGEDITIEVPFGTVIKGEWLSGPLEEFEQDRETRWRRRWVHTSGYEDANEERDAYLDSNRLLDQEEFHRWNAWKERSQSDLVLDFSDPDMGSKEPPKPILLTSGGDGGMGNPAFLSPIHRSPKFASRGMPGAQMKLSLKLKLLADIGLVGFPNAGKSTLVRTLTGLSTKVGSWAFTTLNPRIGVVKVWPGGAYGVSGKVEETKVEQSRQDDALKRGVNLPPPFDVDANNEGLREEFRFTIADIPGLVEDASKNVGLGHSFLQSIERSKALVYVVDLFVEEGKDTLTEPCPEKALLTLREELEQYKEGLSKKARLVIANKADLLVQSPSENDDPSSVFDAEAKAKARLARLQRFVRQEFGLDVVPVSAMWGMNLEAVVSQLRVFVEEAREKDKGREEILVEQELSEPLRIQ